MLKIVVSSPEIREMKGVGKTSGKAYHMRFQNAHAYTVDALGVIADFPDKFEITLDTDQLPYPKGVYTLGAASLYVGREGRLECRPRLVPAPVATKA